MIDLQNENFNYYFLEQVEKIGEAQRALIPRELLFKLYIKGTTKPHLKNFTKLTFLEKLLVLTTLRKKWTLVMEDEDSGADIEKYKELSDAEVALDLFNEGKFVLGNAELMETLEKLNSASVKAAYKYLTRLTTKIYLPPDEYRTIMNFLSRFVNHYESQRKKITLQTNISMAEWLILTFLYDGEPKVCSVLYKDIFRYSYNSSSAKLKRSFGILQAKGMIIKHGNKSSSRFQITALGRQTISELMTKYVVNC